MKNLPDSGELLPQARSAVDASQKLIINSKESQKQLQEMITIQRANLGKTQSEMHRIEPPKFKW